MKQSKVITGTGAALGMLLLILDTRTALSGARDGLDMCIRTVIPSLFPFFFLSILLTGAFSGTRIPFLRPVGKLLRIPEGGESILAAGLLGGYPVGAQSIRDAWSSGRLSGKDARRMLAFCNNAGPAFLFGMASSLFPSPWMAWSLWGIQILSAFLVALCLPGKPEQVTVPDSSKVPAVTVAMTHSLHAISQVCGWVILFRVFIAFFDHWFGWLLPETGQVVFSGILELSNGCCALAKVENTGLRFVLCSGFLSFGGLCVTLQTISATQGLDLGLYFPGKLLQTVISVSLAALVQHLLPRAMIAPIPVVVPAALLILIIFPCFLRNKSGNSAVAGV